MNPRSLFIRYDVVSKSLVSLGCEPVRNSQYERIGVQLRRAIREIMCDNVHNDMIVSKAVGNFRTDCSTNRNTPV